ncbi:glycosyltransferase involved in cell wall biosynthesis [Curtobacterium luteum]|uniref:Glycosyl transferase n=1 Tax=Curtobacterium luteum TaxID=33881 RepID=A0A8H9GCP3_9MICO|nr:glycosyltransferase [Curtobacterium luteum]MBM7803608.1 glycosyltransferase involved in cell wall biosynthesis [Curtobacterium luteum]NUU50121.1 glycosyltransferase [Curtobacterium luteum]GGK99289.1 glycosyl transferase [Curtobacterium luteum]
MSKRVAIIGTRGYPSYCGGFETAVRQVAPALADVGWDVTVYGRPGQERPDDPTLDTRITRRVTRGLESRSLSTLTYGLTAVLDTVRRRPDVALVMNCANGCWLPLLKLAGIPTVVNVDGIEWERAKWGRIAKAVFKTGARMTAWSADRLVFDARAIGEYWQRVFDKDGVVIPYGGTTASALPLHPEDAHLAGRPFALVVARFVPENTVPEFLAAAERIARRFPVVIVGSTGYGGELDQHARLLADTRPDVHWLGHVADDDRLFALWQHAGAYFHGHSVGGTNPALVQAMHLGAPTIARDTVYNREVLADTAAAFVEPRPDAIADAVLTLLSDPTEQNRLSRVVRDRALQHYTWRGVCDAYERALDEQVRGVVADRPEAVPAA